MPGQARHDIVVDWDEPKGIVKEMAGLKFAIGVSCSKACQGVS
jgi:hypothetical protein